MLRAFSISNPLGGPKMCLIGGKMQKVMGIGIGWYYISMK